MLNHAEADFSEDLYAGCFRMHGTGMLCSSLFQHYGEMPF